MEWVAGEHEQIGVPFWRMTKVLSIQPQTLMT